MIEGDKFGKRGVLLKLHQALNGAAYNGRNLSRSLAFREQGGLPMMGGAELLQHGNADLGRLTQAAEIGGG
jgi:hypothetical protein